jgi:hypothetical protein
MVLGGYRPKIKDLTLWYTCVAYAAKSKTCPCGIHVLHPVDKWQACGFPPALPSGKKLDEQNTLKWGKLFANQGRYPFFGE